jgi:ABC-type sugar transport system permease subunit
VATALKKPKQTLIRRIIKNRPIYLMLLPTIVLTCALSIYPILWVARYMFYTYDKVHDPIFVGLDNFARILKDSYFWRTVRNTFVYAAGKLVFTLPISFVTAVILNHKFRGSYACRFIIFLPTLMSAAVMALIWYLVLNVNNGAVNQILKAMHLIKKPINWLGYQNAMKSTIMVAVWGAVGNYMTYFMAGLQGVPQDVYESAELDGITPVKKMFYITIPMVAPAMKTVVMMAITSSFRDISSIMVLTEGGPAGTTDVMYLYLYRFFFPVSSNGVVSPSYGYGAAVAVVCSLIMGVITIVYLRLTKRLDDLY